MKCFGQISGGKVYIFVLNFGISVLNFVIFALNPWGKIFGTFSRIFTPGRSSILMKILGACLPSKASNYEQGLGLLLLLHHEQMCELTDFKMDYGVVEGELSAPKVNLLLRCSK